MHALRLLFKFEAISLIRSRLFRLSVGLLIIVGLYAIFYGKTEMDRQQHILDEIRVDEAKKMESLKAKISTDTLPNVIGNRTYRLVENPPSAWADLSIGQRDIFPYYLYVRYWDLSRQLLTAEIANPEKLLTGNFDLAFVLIYIFPLFIIALSYNIISGEREAGTLALLLSNPVSERSITLGKISFRYLLSFGIAAFLLMLATLICSIKIDLTFLLWGLTIMLYFAFWFGLIFIISNLKKNSSFNAASLLGIWIALVVILPALINIYISSAYAAPPRNDLTQAIRREFYTIWDNYDDTHYRYESSRKLALKYPAYQSDTSHNWEDKYMLAEYDFYDDRLKPYFQKYQDLASRKEQIGNTIGIVSAAVLTQKIFNDLAQTDQRGYQHFLSETESFHAKLKQFFYTPIYQNQSFKLNDFDKIPSYTYQPDVSQASVHLNLLYLFLSSALLWGIGFMQKR